MNKQEFVKTIHSEYSSMLGISEQDISEMVSRGFLVCDKEHSEFYNSHYDAFRKKLQQYRGTKDMLTAGELNDELNNKFVPFIKEYSDLGLGIYEKLAAYKIIPAEYFEKITVEPDIINFKTREEYEKLDVRQKAAEQELYKERILYFFSSELLKENIEFWYDLLTKFQERTQEDEIELNDDTDDEETDKKKDKKTKKTPENENEEVFYEEEQNNEKKTKKTKKEYKPYDYTADNTEAARRQEEYRRQEAERIAQQSSKSGISEQPSYNSVTIPLENGSFITIEPANPGEGYKTFASDTEAARISAAACLNSGDSYQMMSVAGLEEIINYVKNNSTYNSETVPVKISIESKDGEKTILYNESSFEGSIGNFFQEYYKNSDIPEYSDIDKKIQYAIGAVDFKTDNFKTEDEKEKYLGKFESTTDNSGQTVTQWIPPECVTAISPAVYSQVREYAQNNYNSDNPVHVVFPNNENKPVSIPIERVEQYSYEHYMATQMQEVGNGYKVAVPYYAGLVNSYQREENRGTFNENAASVVPHAVAEKYGSFIRSASSDAGRIVSKPAPERPHTYNDNPLSGTSITATRGNKTVFSVKDGEFIEGKSSGSGNSIGNINEFNSYEHEKQKYNVGVSVLDVPAQSRINANSVGSAAGLGYSDEINNGTGLANDRIRTAGTENTSPRAVPSALNTVVFNIEQKGITGGVVNSTLVLNSNRSGSLRTQRGNEVIEGKFVGFATDIGKENVRDKKMSVAEAFERSRSVRNITFSNDGKNFAIDTDWLLHNSKNINKSLADFRINERETERTKKTAAALSELIMRAYNEGAVKELAAEANLKEFVKQSKAKAKEEIQVKERMSLQSYFASTAEQMKIVEAQAKKQRADYVWSQTAQFVSVVPFMGESFYAGVSTIKGFSRYVSTFTRLGQRAAAKQESLNMNKKFMDEMLGYNKTNKINAISRIQAMKDVKTKIQGSQTLRRIGVDKLSAHELAVILKTGKYKSLVLNSREKDTVYNLFMLKISKSGRLDEINGVILFNNRFKNIQLEGIDGKYNFNKSEDIKKALDEIDRLSTKRNFVNSSLRGRRMSMFTDAELQKMLRKKNLSSTERELIESTLMLRNFEKMKAENESLLKNLRISTTIRQGITALMRGTDFGAGLDDIRRLIGRTVAIKQLLKTLREAHNAARINKLLKRYSKDKGIRGRINRTRISQHRQKRFEEKLEKREAKLRKEREKQEAKRKRAEKRKDARVAAANRMKTKFNNTALGKKFANLRDSKIGRGMSKGFGIGKGILKGGIAVPLTIFTAFRKLIDLKNLIIKTLKKYAIMGLCGLLCLTMVLAGLAAAYDVVTGFLYNSLSVSVTIDNIKENGILLGLVDTVKDAFSSDEGDAAEYGMIDTQSTLINDRIQYCVAMDSGLKAYTEGFYTNKDIVDAVTDAESDRIDKEEKEWYNPVYKNTFKKTLQENKCFGTTINGMNTGLHYTYYDGDGNVISMRSNAKDIVAVANTWIGTDLSAKGVYKTYVEKLWAYSHFVGYSIRQSYGNNYIYSCNSHDESAECYNNITLYYCNEKKDGDNSKGTDNVSEKLYEAINESAGSTVHSGVDQQVLYNDVTGAITLDKTIGKNTTVAENDKNKQTKKDNIKDQDSSYKGENGINANSSDLHYRTGGEFNINEGEESKEKVNTKEYEFISLDIDVPIGSAAYYLPQTGELNVKYENKDSSSLSWTIERRNRTETVNDKGREAIRDKIYNYLTSTMGLTTAQACGVLGNIYIECGFDPTAIGRSGGWNFSGICQWAEGYTDGSGTKHTISAGTEAYKLAIKGDLNGQLKLLSDTMNGGYSYGFSMSSFKNNGSTPENAAAYFAANYERCIGGLGDSRDMYNGKKYQDLYARQQTAKVFYNYYTSSVKTTVTETKIKDDNEAIETNNGLVYPDGKKALEYSLNAPYGQYSYGDTHYGMDIGGGNSPYYSCSDGVVLCAFNDGGWHEGFGNVVVVESVMKVKNNKTGAMEETTVRFLYGHSSETVVKKGQHIKAGDQLGKIGNTGNSQGNHLHIEVRVPVDGGWERVNPNEFIKSGGTTVTTMGIRNKSNPVTAVDLSSAPKVITSYDPSGDASVSNVKTVDVDGKTVVYSQTSEYSSYKTTTDVLFRRPTSTTYGSTEKGSWMWVQNSNGCERHEYLTPAAAGCKPTGNEVTAQVLAYFEDTNIDISTLGKNNATTLHPNASVASLKFYNSPAGMCDECKNNKVVYSQYRNINGMQIAEEYTAYYCISHISDECEEKEKVKKEITYYEKETCSPPLVGNGECQMSINGLLGLYNFYNKGSLTNSNGDACNNKITKYHGSSDGIGTFTYFKGYNTKPRAPYCTNYSENETPTGNTVRIPSTSTVTSYTEYYYDSSTGALTLTNKLSSRPNMSNYDHYNSSTGEYYRVEGRYNIYLESSSSTETTYTTYYEYKLTYTCLGHEHCLGHVVPTGSETVTVPYCTGYCCGHELKEYCTGHIDLDVGVVTVYGDESATNSLMNLGVARTADDTTSKKNYQPREENGMKDGQKLTVDTVESKSKNPKDYLFVGNVPNADAQVDKYKAANTKLDALKKYIFIELDGELGKNKYPLPEVDVDLKSKFVPNPGSFVKDEDIIAGLKMVKALVDGEDAWAIASRLTSSGGFKYDYDGDNKITLIDILAQAYAGFAYEDFPDYNDDIAVATGFKVSYGNLINMPTVAKKNTKQVYFLGFYEYAFKKDNENLKDKEDKKVGLVIRNDDYMDTGNIARVHEAMKDDWLQLYQIEFPGAYNAVSTDNEIQKLAFNIAICNYYAITEKSGITVKLPDEQAKKFAEYKWNTYIFIPKLYTFPDTVTKEVVNENTGVKETLVYRKKNGTGFLSPKDAAGKDKTSNCLGKPAFYSGHSDGINFALDWGSTFLEDIGFAKAAALYKNILNTSNYKNAYNAIKGYYDTETKSFKITEEDIKKDFSWIIDVYGGNIKKAMFKFNSAKMFDESLVKEIKSTYLRMRLINEKGFINGADSKWDEKGKEKYSQLLEAELYKLKTGDIVSIGDDVYMVLYQNAGLPKEVTSYTSYNEPKFKLSTDLTGNKEGDEPTNAKVYLVTIGDVDNMEATETNEIHIFSYSLELLNMKRDSIWIYNAQS